MNPENTLRDSLTGAYSRAALQPRLAEEVERAYRYTLPFSLLIIDLDYFKSINDAFGHSRGDQVLKEFAARTHALTRGSDLLFRYGGDEFVLLLPNTNRIQAIMLATRLLNAIRGEAFAGDPPLTLSLSIGCASFPEAGQTAESLWECADQRLYEAKRQGRSRVVAEDPAPVRQLAFDFASRPIERDPELQALRHFLDEALDTKRGLFSISGPRGSGRSFFLAEAIRVARLWGFKALSLRGSPALRTRVYGALAEARADWEGLPPPTAGAEVFAPALCRHLRELGKVGLLIVVDNLADLDRATLDLLRALLFSPEPIVIALAYTAEADSPSFRTSLLEAPLHGGATLRPFSLAGVRLWLRGALQWEAPDSFIAWLYQQTEGLPALLRRGLAYLTEQQILESTGAGWRLKPDFDAVPLGERVGQIIPPHNLPFIAGGFVGREDEIQDLKERLEHERLLCLVGPGGIGKTRLAIQAAAEILELFPDGVFFVPLASVGAPGFIVSAIAQALRLTFTGAESPIDQLINYLRSKELLLVLDNFEHLVDDVSLVSAILGRAPKVRLFITSREPLNIPGEAIFDLRGLPIPPIEDETHPAPFASGAAYSALQLFIQSARRDRPDFALADADRPYVQRICQLVEGLPLGIELAAAWTPLFSCREIAEQISRNIDFLATSRADIPARQRSARAVLDYFWSLLSEQERAWVQGLSVFRGGFDREAAHQVAGASLFFLAALVERSFLSKTTNGRYALHELLRQYAEETLGVRERSPASTAIRRCHAAYFLRLAEQSEPELRCERGAAWLTRFEIEHDNLRAALDWTLGDEWSDAGLRLAGALWQFWLLRGHLSEGRSWLELAIAGSRKAGVKSHSAHPQLRAVLAKALNAAGDAHERLGDYPRAARRRQAGLDLAREPDVNDARIVADALNGLCYVATRQGDYVQARNVGEEALMVARAAGDHLSSALALRRLGIVAMYNGDYGIAARYGEGGLQLYRQLGDQEGIATCLNNLGLIARARGDFAAAANYLAESLTINRAIGVQQHIGLNLSNLGEVARARGDFAAAVRYHEEALAILRAVGARELVALNILNLGFVAAAQNDAAVATQYFLDGMVDSLDLGAMPLVLWGIVGIGGLRAKARRFEQAAELLGLALNHPSNNKEIARAAAPILEDLRAALPANELQAAMERGSRMPVEPVVGRLVAEASQIEDLLLA